MFIIRECLESLISVFVTIVLVSGGLKREGGLFFICFKNGKLIGKGGLSEKWGLIQKLRYLFYCKAHATILKMGGGAYSRGC